MTRINKKVFIKAAKGTGGVQAVVAQRIGVERATISIYVKKNLWAREILEIEREKIVDLAENKLFKAADGGEQWAIERILKSLGKDRGYVEKQEIDHGEGLKIIIERADDGDNKVETESETGDGPKSSE